MDPHTGGGFLSGILEDADSVDSSSSISYQLFSQETNKQEAFTFAGKKNVAQETRAHHAYTFNS